MQWADIFHLYDTGEECYQDNSGFVDSRQFTLWAFNTHRNEKCNLGNHDGIRTDVFSSNLKLYMIRVYIDGSFFVRFTSPIYIDYNFQQEVLISDDKFKKYK